MKKTIDVYCGTYGKYAAGSLEGGWLDLSDYDDMDDFLKACAELHKDESDPEFMFQDISNEIGFPCSGEPGLKEIEKMIELLQLDDFDQKLVVAWYEYYGDTEGAIEDALHRARDLYSGDCDDFDAWAAEMAEEVCFYEYQGTALWNYFDYEAWSRDLSFEYYHASNGIIFHI